MEIYIIRHGQTDWNKNGKLQGGTDVPLNENGREMARNLSVAIKDVKFDRMYCSPLCRARETAEIVKRDRAIELLADERIHEISFGVCEGVDYRPPKEDTPIWNFFFNTGEYEAPEGAETLESIIERAKNFLIDEIEPLEGKYERIAIVAHGAMNKALFCHIKQHGKEEFWSGGPQRNCNVAIVKYEGGNYETVTECLEY
ncbi:MAG: histidine phosphatase family protein [Lachnospiraceae bacterium]|nr:histidine phosphatase family protein [Lachnospiraceae bacterium]